MVHLPLCFDLMFPLARVEGEGFMLNEISHSEKDT